MAILDDEETRHWRNLERWRQNRLTEIAERMLGLNEDQRAFEDGLAIAHRNPGQISDDVVEYLWDNLNHAATELNRLEEEHERLRTMDLPQLVVEANRYFAPKQPRQQESAAATADHLSDQIEQILTAWRELLGIQLDPERVRAHLDSINKWQQQWRERRENAERS